MTASPTNVITSARTKIGQPFRNHFKPVDRCEHGWATVDYCMTVGMDASGYDCSGLVLASICEALGQPVSEWNRNYRHLRQMERLAKSDAQPDIGDILIFHPENDIETWVHIGIAATLESTIHADGIDKRVKESATHEISNRFSVVRLEKLVETMYV